LPTASNNDSLAAIKYRKATITKVII